MAAWNARPNSPYSGREPVTSRCSSRLVFTVTSAAIAASHSAIVRTLWPISMPMSQSRPMKRSTTGVPAASSGRASRRTTSTSEWG